MEGIEEEEYTSDEIEEEEPRTMDVKANTREVDNEVGNSFRIPGHEVFRQNMATRAMPYIPPLQSPPAPSLKHAFKHKIMVMGFVNKDQGILEIEFPYATDSFELVQTSGKYCRRMGCTVFYSDRKVSKDNGLGCKNKRDFDIAE
ncbi:hypothetical protein Vadar_022200 [Vaccinium darrowii]|uniref:Uncharacterized protein n=1 Tax=Vaccinium darrowii TaxID=229202 RepID=A0ACB7YXY9_9ERIC|nr:hypothetical protein Vadar_022200 [Vaccinium darrowii]